MRRTGPTIAVAAGIWLLTRIVALGMLVPLPWVPFDVQLYEKWGQGLLGGSFPIGDPTWQYPDPMAVLLVIPVLLGGNYLWGFTALALLADAGIMAALLWSWHRSTGSRVGLLVWATAGAWIGPVLLERLDVFPTLFAVLSLVVATPWLRAVFSGLGFGLKLWPAVTLLTLNRRQLPRAILAFAGAVVASVVAVRLLVPAGDTFLSAQAGRGLHAESVPASIFVAGALFGRPVDFSETNGTLEIVNERAAVVGTAATVIGLVILILIAVARWTGRLDHLPAADVVAVALLVLMVSSRVLSPQFYAWIGGVLAVALLSRSSRMRIPTVLVIASALTAMYVYPLRSGWSEGELDAVVAQLIRILLLLAALLLSGRSLFTCGPAPGSGEARKSTAPERSGIPPR